jgi:dTDP-glucose 4,6-dehydratase
LYATSKASSELLVKSYNKKYNIDYNIVRLSNIYGPRQYPNKLIPKTIKSILNKKDVEVYGQGNKIRDWTYINDLYLALKKVIEGEVNKTYNISSGNEISNIEIIQKICNIMNDGHNLIKNTHDRDDEFRRSSSNEEIKKIGWEPSIKFSIGLEETVNWYLSNQYFLKEKI